MAVLAAGLGAQLDAWLAIPQVEGTAWVVSCLILVMGSKYAIDVAVRGRTTYRPSVEAPVDLAEGEQQLSPHDDIHEQNSTDAHDPAESGDIIHADTSSAIAPALNVPVSDIWGEPNSLTYTPAEPWNQALTLCVSSGRTHINPANTGLIVLVCLLLIGILTWFLRKCCRGQAVIVPTVDVESAPDHATFTPRSEAAPRDPSVMTPSSSPVSFTDVAPPDWFQVTFEDANGKPMSLNALQQLALQQPTPTPPPEEESAIHQQAKLVEDTNNQLNDTTKKLGETTQKLNKTAQELKTATRQFERKNKVLEEKNEQLASANKRLQEKNQTSVQLARQHLEDKERLEEELDNARSSPNIVVGDDVVKPLQEQVETLSQLARGRLEDKERLAAQLATARSDTSIAEDRARQMQAQLDHLNKQLESNKKTYAAELASARSDTSIAEDLATQLQARLDHLHEQSKETSDLYLKEIDGLKRELDEQNRRLGVYKSSRTDPIKQTQPQGGNAFSTAIETGEKSDLSAIQEQIAEGLPGDQASGLEMSVVDIHCREDTTDTASTSEEGIDTEKQKAKDDERSIDNPEAQSEGPQQIQSQTSQLDERPSMEVFSETSALPASQDFTGKKTCIERIEVAISMPVPDETHNPAAAHTRIQQSTPDAGSVQTMADSGTESNRETDSGSSVPAAPSKQTLATSTPDTDVVMEEGPSKEATAAQAQASEEPCKDISMADKPQEESSRPVLAPDTPVKDIHMQDEPREAPKPDTDVYMGEVPAPSATPAHPFASGTFSGPQTAHAVHPLTSTWGNPGLQQISFINRPFPGFKATPSTGSQPQRNTESSNTKANAAASQPHSTPWTTSWLGGSMHATSTPQPSRQLSTQPSTQTSAQPSAKTSTRPPAKPTTQHSTQQAVQRPIRPLKKTKAESAGCPLPPGLHTSGGLGQSEHASPATRPTSQQDAQPSRPDQDGPDAPLQAQPHAASRLPPWKCTECMCKFPARIDILTHTVECSLWHQDHVEEPDLETEMQFPPDFAEAIKPVPTADDAEWALLNAQRLSRLQERLSLPATTPSSASLRGGALVAAIFSSSQATESSTQAPQHRPIAKMRQRRTKPATTEEEKEQKEGDELNPY